MFKLILGQRISIKANKVKTDDQDYVRYCQYVNGVKINLMKFTSRHLNFEVLYFKEFCS